MNYVTVVYEITDPIAFRDGGNPLRYQHNGLKACTVAAYDAVERCKQFIQPATQNDRGEG